MKLLLYIAAIGNPKIEEKLTILNNNLKYIENTNCFDEITLSLNIYDSYEIITNYLKKYSNKIFIHYKKGILSELFLTNPHNNIIHNHDYILFILDDVKINNINFKDFINIKQKYSIEFLSPKILNGNWPYMYNQPSNVLSIMNHLEIFCIFFEPKDFKKFLEINCIDNKWIWGVDHLFGFLNITTCIYNKYTVSHYFRTNGETQTAITLMHNFLKTKHNTNINYLRQKYTPIKNIIAI